MGESAMYSREAPTCLAAAGRPDSARPYPFQREFVLADELSWRVAVPEAERPKTETVWGHSQEQRVLNQKTE